MEKTVPLIMSEMEIQDIDTEEDWQLAEIKYRLLQERAGKSGQAACEEQTVPGVE